MKRGLLCIDLALIPAEIGIADFFMLLEQKGTIFYDSKRDPKALPPYAILGGVGDVAILDLANNRVRAKFDLMIKLNEIEDKEDKEENKDGVPD